VVVFNVARCFGPDDSTQELKLQEFLESPRCPGNLKTLVSKAGGGHILVESVDTMSASQAAYHERKVAELLRRCERIQKKVHVPYKNPMLICICI